MTNEYRAPDSDTETMDIDELVVTKPTWRTWVPSAVLLVAGALTATAGLQLGLFITFSSTLAAAVPWVLFSCGLVMVMCSLMLGRGRAWAAWMGLGMAGFITVLAFAWNIYLLIIPILSPVTLFMLMADVLACMIMPFSLREATELTNVRNRLYSDP